jgi:hypothetical protein
MLVALIVYGMPFDQTALSASEGAAFGPFPRLDRRDLGDREDGHDDQVGRVGVQDVERDIADAARGGELVRRCARQDDRLAGKEGDLFRKVLGWSLVLILVMCAIIYLQSTAVLDWMVVK